MNMLNKRHEANLRRAAINSGYAVRKSRIRNPHINNQGDYMLVDAKLNICVLGSRFDADLDQIAKFLGR